MKLKIDSPVFEFINTLCEFICLNLLFLACCLPIITCGAAISSLYQVTMQEARGEHGYIVKKFFTSFKENFRSSTPVFLLYLAAAFILIFNLAFWSAMGSFFSNLLLLAVTFASLAALISFLYAFPLLARFENTTRRTIINAYTIAMSHRKQTLAVLAVHTAVAAACFFVPGAKIFMVLLGFSFTAYCCSYFFIKVFNDYEEEAAEIKVTDQQLQNAVRRH